MNRISEKLANVFGSVGIAALAIAILLVPYSDLNAAASSSEPLCINNCGSAVVTSSPGGSKGVVCMNGSKNGTCDPAQKGASCYTCQIEVLGGNYYCYCEAR